MSIDVEKEQGGKQNSSTFLPTKKLRSKATTSKTIPFSSANRRRICSQRLRFCSKENCW